MFDYIVFIGRFQPFHAGHKAVVDQALRDGKEVILVVGHDQQARDFENPFTVSERIAIIRTCFTAEELSRISFTGQRNYLYDNPKWVEQITTKVHAIANRKWRADGVKIGLIGYKKDFSSEYLDWFPHWTPIPVERHAVLNATDIRNSLYKHNDILVDSSVWDLNHELAITSAARTVEFGRMRKEYDMIQAYKKAWEAAPYPPTFVTVDAVVTQSANVLLVERGAEPGKGLWALPGGFLETTETVKHGAIRELIEETRIKVETGTLLGSIKNFKVFDHPKRSLRGRTITNAFHIDLPPKRVLPKVKGADDAKKAFWVSFSEVKDHPENFFEDHFDIISYFTGV